MTARDHQLGLGDFPDTPTDELAGACETPADELAADQLGLGTFDVETLAVTPRGTRAHQQPLGGEHD